MRRRRLILLVAAGLLAASAAVWFFTREREPSYNGRTLTEWLDRYDYQSALVVRDNLQTETREAAEAVRHIGTNALPCLMKWLCYEADWKKPLDDFARKLPQPVRPALESGGEEQARYASLGFRTLGSVAAPAIPDLLQIVNNPATSLEVRERAGDALASIGQPALAPMTNMLASTNSASRHFALRVIIGMNRRDASLTMVGPLLVQSIRDPDENVAAQAAHSLGYLHIQAAISVPALTNGLRDARRAVRLWSARGLFDLGTNAHPAVPALISALDDRDPRVRNTVSNALWEIDPKALEKAGAGAGDAEKH